MQSNITLSSITTFTTIIITTITLTIALIMMIIHFL